MDRPISFTGGPGGSGFGGFVGTGGDGGDVNVHIYGQGSSGSVVLMSLPRAHYAGYDSGRKDLPSSCHEGTRIDILKGIMTWLKSIDDNTPPVYWLNGIAGIGKSTIARTIAERAHSEGMLGASFFFSRSDQSLSNPHALFPTLAFQLANADSAFKTVIVEALERDPGVAYKSLLPQLEGLILAPLLTTDRNRQSILIILDAMDECEESGAEEILQYLFSHATQIPFLRILITSRPEPHISSVFDEGPNHAKTVLHDIEASIVQEDIRRYVYAELEKITRKFRRRMTSDWATEAQIQSLVERSGKLFIYAATCIRFISDNRVRDPRRHLHIILDTQTAQQTKATPYRQLDSLYMGILHNSLSDSDPEVIVERFQAVIGSIVTLREPLPLDSLARFVQYETEIVDATLYHLHSIIIPPSNIHEAPRVYHPSFLDFITDSRRCSFPDFVIVPIPDQERRHAIRCFELMAAFLKRDVAGISDPSLLNSEVDGFEQKVNGALPPEVQYACKFWASHLSRVGFGDQTMVDALERFSTRSILWWLEAMSLIGSSFTAAGCIREAQHWAIGSGSQATIVTMLSDAYRFILAHAKVIRESALHVYLSALPFTPHDTALFKTYRHETDYSIRVLQGVESQWPQTLGIFLGHSGKVLSVAFSPDGSRLASGSDDNSVRLWDATSGHPIASLEGHSDEIYSIAFSPDGSRLASGSKDNSIWLWDATSGKPIELLESDSDMVSSVEFSPDSSRLASGSGDHSVQLWDATSGELIASLEGHSGPVTSVAFSSDGLLLASGSEDHSVRLWDATSGKPIASLEGHEDTVSSVAFSRDGLRLASGSGDHSVQLWDAISGEPITSLEGHFDSVTSVKFSSNGLQLASGSRDRSIRLWDAVSGEPIASLEGHSDVVYSIAFSPDGSRLASGSEDRSIRLWDAALGKSIAPLQGHSAWVTSVKFSSDGLWLASGSEDQSVQLWDAMSGQLIASLEGHEDTVSSVEFAPDGSRLASGSEDHSVRLWDVTSGEPIASLEGHSGVVYSIAFSPDGSRLASGSEDHSARLWDATSGQPIATLEGHSDMVSSVAFSLDGSRLASGSFDHSVRLWDAKSGALTASLDDHSAWVKSVIFSPDGLWLAASCVDHSVWVWDVTSGELIGSLEDIVSLAFSVDDHTLTSQSQKETFTWDLTPPPPFRMVSESHTAHSPSVGPSSLIWSFHGQWLQVQSLPGNHVRRICCIPALYLSSTEVQVTSLLTQSRIAIGCRDGRVIILHIQHKPFRI